MLRDDVAHRENSGGQYLRVQESTEKNWVGVQREAKRPDAHLKLINDIISSQALSSIQRDIFEMAANKQYVQLAQSLPPRLTRFFARWPPRAILEADSTTTPSPADPTAPPPSTSAAVDSPAPRPDPRQSEIDTLGFPSPFKSQRHPVTGKWHDPVFSLRRQAELVKLARQHGVEELLPPSVKSTEERMRKRVEHGLRVKGTGVGQRVKGKESERTLKARPPPPSPLPFFPSHTLIPPQKSSIPSINMQLAIPPPIHASKSINMSSPPPGSRTNPHTQRHTHARTHAHQTPERHQLWGNPGITTPITDTDISPNPAQPSHALVTPASVREVLSSPGFFSPSLLHQHQHQHPHPHSHRLNPHLVVVVVAVIVVVVVVRDFPTAGLQQASKSHSTTNQSHLSTQPRPVSMAPLAERSPAMVGLLFTRVVASSVRCWRVSTQAFWAPLRPHLQLQIRKDQPLPRKFKHAPCTSYREPLRYTNASDRPRKRSMTSPNSTIAVVNSSGRQAASFIRVASAVGYTVRAQLRNLDGIVANEISSLPHVRVLVGDLYTKSIVTTPDGKPEERATGVNFELIEELFQGAQLAFINTTFWGDEVAIGKALADAAARVGIKHYIYSSMPNHSLANPNSAKTYPSIPLWSSKSTIESYIRTSLPQLPTTFLYTGIYNNNFTSLPYPLFCMALQPDGSFLWVAPFHPHTPVPWLDAEHDVGPSVLQIFKDGPDRWKGQRIALAFEKLSPVEACERFERGVGRRVRYKRGEIEIKVKIPQGYREQLTALQEMYFGRSENGQDNYSSDSEQPPYFGTSTLENSYPEEALRLWEGYRGLEEYAREVFPLEEAANGLMWMNEELDSEGGGNGDEEEREYGSGGEGGEQDMDVGDHGFQGENTPARREEGWLA
ncbi:hypothetical protein B7494_g7957 [Chlorociboria aeruginascens]|nr:hypothetical protein B7494_g7957 [Chlorociboria aeruginascens]